MYTTKRTHPYLSKFFPFWENNPLYTEETKKQLRESLR
jgi:hypothetical protein